MDKTEIKKLVDAKIAEFDYLYDQAQLVKHRLQKSMRFPEYGMVSHPVQINRLLLRRKDEITTLQQLLV